MQKLLRWKRKLLPDARRRQRARQQLRKALAIWLDADSTRILLRLDHPPYSPNLRMLVRGAVEFRGWALATRGIQAIAFSSAGHALGMAWHGLPRTDVAAHYPHYPDALHSGFHFLLDTLTLPDGITPLTIIATGYDGATAFVNLTLEVDNREAVYSYWRRRTRPSAASLQWMRRAGGNWKSPPCFQIELSPSADQSRNRLTLLSVLRQAYPHWRLPLSAELRGLLPTALQADQRLEQGPTDGICLKLQAGCLLEPHALFELARAMILHPEAGRITALCDAFLPPTGYWPTQAMSPRLAVDRGNGSEVSLDLGQVLASCWEDNPPHMPSDGHQTPPTEPTVLVHAPCPMLPAEEIRRILAVKLDHLGDVLLALPALRRLHEAFPHAEITALVGPWAKPLVEKEPWIHHVLTRDFFQASSTAMARELEAQEKREIWDWLSPLAFDLAIDLRREPETRPFLQCSGARFTAGFAYEHDHAWLTVAVICEANNARKPQHRQVTHDLLLLVDAVAQASRDDARPRAKVSDEDRVAACSMLPAHRPLIGFQPGAGRPIKCWPAASYTQLADKLCERYGAQAILFGSPAEQDLAEGIVSQMRQPGHVMAGRLNLRQLLAVLPELILFVGNDTGPTHMAAAAGIPTLAITSGTNDATQWVPMGPHAASIQKKVTCSPCYKGQIEECPFLVRCLGELSVEEVFQAAIRLSLTA